MLGSTVPAMVLQLLQADKVTVAKFPVSISTELTLHSNVLLYVFTITMSLTHNWKAKLHIQNTKHYNGELT